MKKIVFIFSLIVNISWGQNLVPNPSFEDTVACPQFYGDITRAAGWRSFSFTPDYYNSCASPPYLNVPYTDSDFYQFAHSGNAMAGIITYAIPAGSSGANAREHMGISLITPLVIGTKYFVSFYMNYSGYGYPSYRRIACNKIGLKFSTNTVVDTLSPPPLTNWAHLFTDSILIDTVGWLKVSGSFIADSAYTYVVLGNFFDSTMTDTIDLGGPLFAAAGSYHYIDDVCVSVDSLYNETWTSLNKPIRNSNSIFVYPNPSSDFLNIRSDNVIDEILLINFCGQIFDPRMSLFDNSIQISVENIANGIYFVRIRTKSQFLFKKINIIH